MIFRQLFDINSFTYSYLIGCKKRKEAVIVDPVYDNVAQYIRLFNELDLRLVAAIDTHIHADHITGAGLLKQKTACATAMGIESKAELLSLKLKDQEQFHVDDLALRAIYTPGHTDDSYSFFNE